MELLTDTLTINKQDAIELVNGEDSGLNEKLRNLLGADEIMGLSLESTDTFFLNCELRDIAADCVDLVVVYKYTQNIASNG